MVVMWLHVTARVHQDVSTEMDCEVPGDMSLNNCMRGLVQIAFTQGTNGHSLGEIYHCDEIEDTDATHVTEHHLMRTGYVDW